MENGYGMLLKERAYEYLLHGVARDAANGHVGTALIAGRHIRLRLCIIRIDFVIAACN